MSVKKGSVEKRKGNIYHPEVIVFDKPEIKELPGINSEKINPSIEVEGGLGNSFMGYTNTTIGSWAVGTKTISGVGFKPKNVQILAWTIGGSILESSSNGISNDSNGNCMTNNPNGNGVQNDKIIYLRTSAPLTVFSANLIDFTNDGFSINIDTYNNTYITHIQYICYR